MSAECAVPREHAEVGEAGGEEKLTMENSGNVTNIGKIGFGLSLVPWVVLPLLLLLPGASPGRPAADPRPPATC